MSQDLAQFLLSFFSLFLNRMVMVLWFLLKGYHTSWPLTPLKTSRCSYIPSPMNIGIRSLCQPNSRFFDRPTRRLPSLPTWVNRGNLFKSFIISWEYLSFLDSPSDSTLGMRQFFSFSTCVGFEAFGHPNHLFYNYYAHKTLMFL